MISIRTPDSPTSSPASPAIRLTGSTSCAHGTGDLQAPLSTARPEEYSTAVLTECLQIISGTGGWYPNNECGLTAS